MTEAPDPDVAAEAAATLAELIEDDADDPSFDAPWQARAFALTVAIIEEADCDWGAFQGRFIDRIQTVDPDEMQRDVEAVYFEQWLATLEDTLTDADLLRFDELEGRQSEFEAGDRDESEFVLEDPPNR